MNSISPPLTIQSMYDFDREEIIPLILKDDYRGLVDIKENPYFASIKDPFYRKILDALLKKALEQVDENITKNAMKMLLNHKSLDKF